MEKIGIILVSEKSLNLAKLLQRELREVLGANDITIYHKGELDGCVSVESVSEITQKIFTETEGIIFIGAMGICIRSIAPMVNDKHEDPAVICVDSTGRFVISVLSGHIGGANNLTHIVASITGGEGIVTTQSDNTGLWALDTFTNDYGWQCSASAKKMNEAISLFVAERPTALILEVNDKGAETLEATLPKHVKLFHDYEEYRNATYRSSKPGTNSSKPDLNSFKPGASKNTFPFELVIIISAMVYPKFEVPTLQFFPPVLHLGVGCQKLADKGIARQLLSEIKAAGYATESIATVGTIALKKDEPMIAELMKSCPKARLKIYSAKTLNDVEIPNPSQKVFETTGAYGVAEAAALLGDENGKLIIEKQKGSFNGEKISHYTYALAISSSVLRQGHIEIVGAGPGDPELVSVRGRRFLKKADLILYAGSLVPRELTFCAKRGATVRSSASMNLEEQFELMKQFYDKGKLVVRLHTGDPCIYGAIQEQMNYFDTHGMRYHITPGISSFQAAAAELKSQFTIPEKVQTIILTRGEGRTPMPEKEKLHLLARSQSTMCIFLSANIAEQVQKELLECYPPETPVAVCYKLTWKGQRIYRGVLQNLSAIVKENDLTLTTMIVVGEAIDNREGLSKLYDKNFSHLYRNN